MFLINDVTYTLNYMYLTILSTFPHLKRKRDIKIQINYWDFSHVEDIKINFHIWDGNDQHHIQNPFDEKDSNYQIPLKDWDKFINYYRLLFKKFN